MIPAPTALAGIPPGADLLTAPEAAAVLCVVPATLANLAKAGRVPFVRTPGGHRRYPKAALLRMRAAAGDASRFRSQATFGHITRGEAVELLMTAGHGLTADEAAMMIGGTK